MKITTTESITNTMMQETRDKYNSACMHYYESRACQTFLVGALFSIFVSYVDELLIDFFARQIFKGLLFTVSLKILLCGKESTRPFKSL
jgi:hypothetical protein